MSVSEPLNREGDGIMATTQAKTAGMVMVGEWGFGASDAGHIWAKPEDAAAVRAAYDAIEDGDMGPGVLDDVRAAGGVYIRG